MSVPRRPTALTPEAWACDSGPVGPGCTGWVERSPSCSSLWEEMSRSRSIHQQQALCQGQGTLGALASSPAHWPQAGSVLGQDGFLPPWPLRTQRGRVRPSQHPGLVRPPFGGLAMSTCPYLHVHLTQLVGRAWGTQAVAPLEKDGQLLGLPLMPKLKLAASKEKHPGQPGQGHTGGPHRGEREDFPVDRPVGGGP